MPVVPSLEISHVKRLRYSLLRGRCYCNSGPYLVTSWNTIMKSYMISQGGGVIADDFQRSIIAVISVT